MRSARFHRERLEAKPLFGNKRKAMVLLIGFTLVRLLGIAHYYGLMAARRIRPHSDAHPEAVIIVTFLGLLVLHTLEILAFSGIYRGLLAWGGLGARGGTYSESWGPGKRFFFSLRSFKVIAL